MFPKKLFAIPVLVLIFLRFANQRFASVEQELTSTVHVGSRRIMVGICTGY